MIFRSIVPTSTLVLLGIALAGLCVFGYIWARRGIAVRPEGKESPLLTWTRRALISALMVFALAGPAVQAEEIETTTNIEIVFAVDRTGSMGAEDMAEGTTRIDAVRDDIIALLDATGGSRYSIVTWDSTSRVELPFTTDGSAARSFAEVLHQEITEFSKGSSIERPVRTLNELLVSAQEQRPENIRYLIVFTDGESTDAGMALPDDMSWDQLAHLIDGGAVIGYGTEQGGPMKVFVPGAGLDGETGEYMTDPATGGQAISRIDVASLQGIADSLGVKLLLNPTEAQVDELGVGLMDQAESLPDRTGLRHRYRYMVWIPAVTISLLLLWEVYADARELSRMRRTGAI